MTLRHLATVMAPLLLTACVSSGPPSQSGIRVGDATLAQFKAGVTTESWLFAVLGHPTSSSPVEGVSNTTVHKYVSGESASGLGSLFTGNASKNTAIVFFIVTDGIVTRFWADRAVERDALGKPVETPAAEKQK